MEQEVHSTTHEVFLQTPPKKIPPNPEPKYNQALQFTGSFEAY
jgi:hypothetical protein